MRRTRRILMMLALTACGSTTDADGTAPDVRGTWQFDAARANPPAQYAGELRIEEQEGRTIRGSIELAEEDASGHIDRIAGVVNGRITTQGTVDFDAFLGSVTRRHIGRVVGDSMSGSWAEVVQPPQTGSFTAKRTGS